ncbi:hypothetical protein [Kiritimatiella glycovorans]|uniref:Uncharacterized protein n=1 Tax=Kiritimatiella glycovorans TaxID=1307763 RepID=A0A0G3EJ68_9BACT|nr:hypothetical protein [Kiritimatiella glycovorans]AKJ64820.1 hypothetical protein L21SP4_01577 [Kiritimatiella glycovorans]
MTEGRSTKPSALWPRIVIIILAAAVAAAAVYRIVIARGEPDAAQTELHDGCDHGACKPTATKNDGNDQEETCEDDH